MDSLAAIFARQNLATVVWVEKEFFVSIVIFDNEVAGHTHAGNRKFQAAANFQVDDGQRDRNSDKPIEHVVEEAVPRIVIVFGIAAKSDFLK